MKRIDLNCDMGELPEAIADGTQEALDALVHFHQRRLRWACGRCANDGSHDQAGASLALGHWERIPAIPIAQTSAALS